ncbi:PQQ-dependent sugar dehydrogenase [Jonesia quinghaiensis]|uniref:PQQ-dependent sugar dehydrogenase n=1 Tax=Jonesia quinghaiensis TaxID=262806 RepID=UPI000412B0BD|nr:PQQ-dependent sugar dehydrogenase [Jonesia quinghaiensis]
MTIPRTLTVLVLASALGASCSSGAQNPDAPVDDTAQSDLAGGVDRQDPDDTFVVPTENYEPVAESLDSPWSLTWWGDTGVVSSRDTAEILEVLPDGSTRVMGIVDGVVHGGEGGLLGLAVSPGKQLFAYSTGQEGNRVDRFIVEGEAGSLSIVHDAVIVDQIPAGRTHNGGRIAFGPDDMLYVATGDAGNPDTAQDPASLAGKILRMTVDGEPAPDNPEPDSLVYSLGHRNVQGITWAQDGTMFATEFGQSTWDELNEITPGGNYGWPQVEGIAQEEGFIDPVQQWEPADASPSGVAYADGSLLIANLRGQRLTVVPVDSLGDSSEFFVGEFGRLRDVVATPDGGVWLMTNNTDGRGNPGDGDDRILELSLSTP